MAEVITLARYHHKEQSDTKVCANCGDEKPVDDFPKKEGRNVDGRSNFCTKCQTERQKNYDAKRKDKELVIGYNERNPFDWAYENFN